MLLASLQAPADYVIGVRTRGERNSGTDANVFITVDGSTGSLTDIQLKDSLSHMDKFERASIDWFIFSLPQPLGDVKRVSLRSDNSGMFSAWSPESVVIFNRKHGTESVWTCDGSLNKQRPVAELRRAASDSTDAVPSNYLFSIRLGSSSVPAKAVVSLTLSGSSRTEKVALTESILNRDRFLKESADAFFVSTAASIGTLTSVLLEVDSSGKDFQVRASTQPHNIHISVPPNR
jgi:hypothetical protein